MNTRPPASLPALPGSRYAPVRVHSQGRYALLCEGWDVVAGRPCAIKILTCAPASLQAELIWRLRSEAAILSQLDHPGILRCDYDGTGELPPHIVVEWIGGGSLRAGLEAAGQPLPADRAAAVGLDLLGALAVLHDHGIVHRDIKPDNILLRGPGQQAVLCDFGIAQRSALERRTVADTAMGTMTFMAPEQRIDARSAGPAADLYAVGCTLYQAVTGWSPYNLFMAGPDSPRWEVVPAPLAVILHRATRRDPGDRYPGAAEMAGALQRALAALSGATAGPLLSDAGLDGPETLPLSLRAEDG
jgi:serine/threonine protein kinase